MHRIKGLKIYFIITLVLVLGLILGPNVKWLNPGFWWGQSLVVLMNENEARPCGGFVTAYGVVNIPVGGVELSNSFAFPPVNLGLSPEPLNRVSAEQKFWDLGTNADLNRCGQEFVSAYERATGNFPKRVFLVQSGLLEDYLGALGPVTAGNQTLSAQNFFALTSRLVSDIDRHDENTLAERKDPLHSFGKRLITTSILRPWRWHALSQVVYRAEQNGTLYVHRPGQEKPQIWQQNKDRTVSVSEWNLGGGKSSRYLDKHWTVFLAQVGPDRWEVSNRLEVTHLGQEDKPLSQDWQGGFEFNFFNIEDRFVPATIATGETFTHTETFTLNRSDLFRPWQSLGTDLATLSLYAPPYQNWHSTLQVSALAQQTLKAISQNLTVQESTAVWRGETDLSGEAFSFTLEPDTLAPFLTWHKPLLDPSETVAEQLALTEGDIVVELHFNEPVNVLNAPFETLEDGRQRFAGSDLNIELLDRDFEVKDVTQNLSVTSGLLFTDNTTLLLKITPETYQLNERYYLAIEGIADQWGNTKTITNRTVITR